MNVTFTIDSRRANFRVDTTFILGSEYNVAFSDAIQRRVVLYAHNGQPVADTADGSTLSLDTAELLEQFKINGIESKCPRTITVHCCIIDSDGDTIATGDVQVMYSRFYTAPNGTLTAIDTKGPQGIPGPKGDTGEDGRDGVVTDISAGYVAFTVPSEGPNAGHLVAHVADLNDFYAKDINGQPDTTKPRWIVRDDDNGERHLYYCIYTEDGNARAIDLGSVQGPQGIQGEAGEYNFDNAPTLNSTNPVTSSGIFIAIDNERTRAEQAEEALRAKIAAVYKYKGSVATKEALPTASAAVGDVWNVEEDGANYAYNGNGVWDALGGFVDLSEYAKSQDVANAIQNTAQSLSNNLQAEVEKLKTQLASKVNVEAGKGLSTFDFSNTHKAKLEGIEEGAQKNPDLTPYAKAADVKAYLNKKVDKEDGKGLSTEDYTTQEKNDLANLKAKRFDIEVDGIRQPPVNGVVNVPTNYDRNLVIPSAGIAEVEANKVNIIEEWSVGLIDNWIPEIEKPINGAIYWDEENQVWNTADLYTDDGFSGAGGIGSLHDDWNLNTPTPKDGFYGYTDLHADYSIEQATATTPIQDIDDGYGYTMKGFVADIVFRNNTTGELRTITNFTFVAWNGIDDPTNTSLSQSETRYEEDGSEWYTSDVWGDVSQLIVDDPTTFEPIDITYMFADTYPMVSLRLGFRREQSQELQEILLKTPNEQGVADYIVDITIPDGALDIYIRSENYYGFVSSNAKALALEAGRNLLTFTELNGDFLVNRAMLKEVGV